MTKITRSIKASEVVNNWVVIDATDIRLGQLASKASSILLGKNKVTRTDYLDGGDNVIVINAAKVSVNSTALRQKMYYRHSGYMSGLSSKPLSELLVTNPQYVIEQAVWGMLPKTRMGRKILKRLHVFADENHNMQAQTPTLVKVK